MTEKERLLNNDNNILQNQNICYADGEEQAKKDLEQFKQNLIESFNEAELREEFIDECNDTEKQESIKLENVDSLFAYKRFHFGYVCGDTGLIDEQAELKWFIENCCSIKDLKKNWKTVCNKLNELHEENEKLTKQLMDLKILINNLSVQRDEFFNGARENAELNGKLQKENEQLRLQMLRLYNYFEDNLKEEMNPTVFSEMWDIVKRELKSYMGD